MSLLIVIKTNYFGEGMCRNWNDSIALIKAVVRNATIGQMLNDLILPPFSPFEGASPNELPSSVFCVYFILSDDQYLKCKWRRIITNESFKTPMSDCPKRCSCWAKKYIVMSLRRILIVYMKFPISNILVLGF